MAKSLIKRGSTANTFADAKLDVTHELSIPVAVITEEQIPASMALGPTKRIFYKDQDGNLKEVATVDQIEGFLKKEDISGLFPVTYSSPTSSLATTASLLDLEIGETISVPLTATYVKRDGGDILSTVIKKDNVDISTDLTYTDNNVKVTANPITYRAVINYDQGPIKNNSLGDPVATGRIPAGATTTNTITVRGHYFVGYGAVMTVPTDMRLLAGQRLTSESDTFILEADSFNLKQVIAVPPNKTLNKVIDLSASSQDITIQYVLQENTVSVTDAAGTPIQGYKVYVRTQGTTYSLPHNHQITLSTL